MAKAASKSEIIKGIVKTTKLSRKQVVSVFDSLTAHIKKDLSKRGIFQVPGLMKLTVVHEIDKPNSKIIEAVSNGWPAILSSLKSFLETGRASDWPARA